MVRRPLPNNNLHLVKGKSRGESDFFYFFFALEAKKDALRPGVAALLGELAGASSIDYVTAGREWQGMVLRSGGEQKKTGGLVLRGAEDAMRPRVAALLGELAGASSTDYVTARREGK